MQQASQRGQRFGYTQSQRSQICFRDNEDRDGIQNCAKSAPRRFGSKCRPISFIPEKPEARAIHTNSEFIRSLAPEDITLADAAQPSNPSKANVTVTEACGEMFSGSTQARTVIKRKSHGTDRKKSISSLQQLVLLPAKVAPRDTADQARQRSRQECSERSQSQRDAHSIEKASPAVAAKVVRSQRMVRGLPLTAATRETAAHIPPAQ